jgi:hypothetical protein
MSFPDCWPKSTCIIKNTQKLRISKKQFGKHVKLKKKKVQSVDTLLLLRMGNKIPMEGATETKFGADISGRKDHPETAPPRTPCVSNTKYILKCLLDISHKISTTLRLLIHLDIS